MLTVVGWVSSRRIRIIKYKVFVYSKIRHIIKVTWHKSKQQSKSYYLNYGFFMGIHYDYKSKRGERAMLKEAKRKARLAQRRAKRLLNTEPEATVKKDIETHDIKKTITLDDLTNPSQK